MTRALVAGAALLLAAPAAAQDTPAWVGVWDGQVGTFPVRLCIDVRGDDGPGRGAYYYLSQLEPIPLSDEDSDGGWTEQGPDGAANGLWEFTEQDRTRLRGTWRQGRRSLAFDLRPLAWTEGEWGGACSSAAFLQPRVGGGAIVAEAADRGGWRYTKRIYRPAAQFAEDVVIETFAYPSTQPGDAAINDALAAYLPRETVDDAFVQCSAGNIASFGRDGTYYQVVEPRMVSRRYLTVAEANETDCGGAHPNSWTGHQTYDRQTGAPVDLADWIGSPFEEGVARPLPARLRELVLARFPDDRPAGDECLEVVATEDFWSLELTLDGIAFTPDLPRVVMACGESVLLPWPDLAPFLDDEGRAGLARLRGG